MRTGIKHKALAILTAFLMVFAMMPMATEPVLADDDIPEYTVTLDPGIIGGEPITVKSTNEGMLVQYPNNPGQGQFQWNGGEMYYRYPYLPDSFNDPDYTFTGWTSTVVSSVEAAGCFVSLQSVTDNHLILTAQWNYKYATISFYPNGGSGTMDSDMALKGNSYTVPDCGFTAPSNKVFKGWINRITVHYITQDIMYYPGDTITPNEDITLLAYWENPKLSLCSYDYTNGKSAQGGNFRFGDGQDWSPGCNNYTLIAGQSCTVVAAPDNDYAFLGWYKGEYIGIDEQGLPVQDARPYMDQLITTDRNYSFSADSDLVLCAVFAKADELDDLRDAKISGLTAKAYNGKAQTQDPVIKMDVNGTEVTLKNGVDYDVAYSNNVNAGTATVTITGKGFYTGTASATFKINKAANPLSVTARTVTLKAKKLKKKTQKLAAAKVMTVSHSQGAVSYKLAGVKKAKFRKYFKVDARTGNVTVKKKLKKGKYKLTISVTAAGSGNYNAATKTVIATVKVK